MQQISQIWDLLVHSNTFNFIVMMMLLAWLVKKFKLGDVVENLKNSIIDNIEKSKLEKGSAIKILNEAQDEVKNLDNEVISRLQQAEEHGKSVAERIINETKSKVKQIENNVQRVVEAEEKTISSKLTSKTVKASVELAKDHIKKLLAEHPELHDKYINESIDEIDRIKI